ncbi:MAG: class I SAM-dependent methyltransferase [Anaerolineae bacterium]
MIDANQRAISLGHPSYVWRFGQDRRLGLMQQYVPLAGRRVLDVGCGLGLYLQRFRTYSQQVCGVDADLEKLKQAGPTNVCVALAEALPFADGSFDVVNLHEVIEHVNDDHQAIREAHRCAREGGRLVIFAPNRLYPFETHGVYWRGKYHFGNVPLINYLPSKWRARLCPHVRVYTGRDIENLFDGLTARTLVHTQIYPGYDKIASRYPWLASFLRRVTYALENTPLRMFGLSHFVVMEKGRGERE